MKKSYHFFFFCFVLCAGFLHAQDTTHTEKQKERYLKKLEKKNNQYLKVQERKTKKLLSQLSSKEKHLLAGADSAHRDSSVLKTSFSAIENDFSKSYSSLSTKLSVSPPSNLSLSSIPQNLDTKVQSYLKEQVTVSAYLNDTSCKTCKKLKTQAGKTQKSLSETTAKLEYLKTVQDKIKKHQETHQGYFGSMPQYADQLKGIEKNCFYFNQGMNGFSSIFANPAAGIEKSMMQSLSFNKSYACFANGLKLPQMEGLNLGGTVPDLKGYQTRAQVQALLPQNNPGISADQKSALISNMQTSMTQFATLRTKNPGVALFKDKPCFKPNPYKGLPLRQRLVLGKDFQMHPRTKYFPVTADFGLSLAFKLSARFSPLAGVAYKLGLGQALQNMSLSDQGIITRIGLDAKLCYGFSLQGLFEETWRTHLVQINETHSHSPEPALILAIVNKVKIGRKSTSSFMFGYDFFYDQHIPVSSPWVIRIGF